MAYGVTTEGFVRKPFEVILAEIKASLKAAFGENIDLSDTSNFNQFANIMADREDDLWQLAEAVYNSGDPDAAEGAALILLCAITGTVPNDAEPSTVDMYATGDDGTSLLTGRQASVAVTAVKFGTTEDATLALADAWTALTAYVVGDVVSNSGNIYFCTDPGTSAASGGPSGEGTGIVDSGVLWSFVGEGLAYAVIPAEATLTGPLTALTGTLTTIETPVSGWTSVNNMADAIPGTNLETDAELRLRREDELQGNASSIPGAIRTRILEEVDGVTQVLVFQNDTGSVNSDGMPPHSVEALVIGGDDQDIFDKVFAVVAAGITKYGTETGTTTADPDNGNQSYDSAFSRPDDDDIWIEADITKDPVTFPDDGESQIVDALLAYGIAKLVPGKDVVSSALKAVCFSVEGVLDVTELDIDTAPAPSTETTIPRTVRERGVLDSARITLNLIDGTP